MKKKIISLVLVFVLLCVLPVYAHSGRTDANGGHRDNNNVSGLGYYHYHCGGYPAHLHSGGVCPYRTNSYAGNVSGAFSTSSTSKPRATYIKSVSNIDDKYIKVTWAKRSNATKYYVYRSDSRYGTFSKIGSTTKTYYNDKTVKNNKLYYYKIRSIGKNGYKSKLCAAMSAMITFKGQIDLSETVLQIGLGEVVPIYVEARGIDRDIVAEYDTDCVEIEWVYPDTGGMELYIYAKRENSEPVETTIKLYFDGYEKIYYKTITITIDSTLLTVYKENNNVPDLGNYFGINVYPVIDDGVVTYIYDLSSIMAAKHEIQNVFFSYGNLLIENGYIFYQDGKTDDGGCYQVYTKNGIFVKVAETGNSSMSAPCVSVTTNIV